MATQSAVSVAEEASKVNFARQILPILSNKCFVCHGPDATDPDLLRLDSYELATKDLGGHKAIDPSAPDKSEMLARLQSAYDPMPPKDAEKQLTDAERTLLMQWVQQGGNYARHWAFVPPEATLPAALVDAPQSQVVDYFVAAQLTEHGSDFAPEANKAVLARRAALVLTGLPPSPEQLSKYLADSSPEAYDNYVGKLLESTAYGEHQARYWLDAIRYGDTHGLHLDNRRGIYPYRDWVIRALNENLPLDEFITWQLAGDLLPNPTLEQQVATGYVRMNPTTAEGGAIPEEFQAKNNFDRVETLGTVFLGLSLTCARCHSHKYDPIPQTEYYQLLAFFNSTSEHSMDGNKYDYSPVVNAPADDASWEQYNALMNQREELLKNAAVALSEAADLPEEKVTEWNEATAAKKLELLATTDGPFAELSCHADAKALQEQFTAAEATFTTSLVAVELEKPRPTYVLDRGEYNLPKGDPLTPDVLGVLGQLPEDVPRNRLGLARWLTSRDNPLVARVLVNRMWQQVFGYGLVRTPEDFGYQGEQPTHPELLDWLAVELQESGWDLKHMMRVLVNSRTFRQSSAMRADLSDPENRLWGRGPSFRLDAEVIRDMGLYASGLIDPHIGGEGVKPYQPAGLWSALMHPASNTKNYVRDNGSKIYRRSLYMYWKRTSPHPMMTLFDAPSRESSCVRRSRTNTSLQSLGLLNETQRVETARVLAQRLMLQRETDGERLDLLFTLAASRAPNERERAACMQLLTEMQAQFSANEDGAEALLSIGDAPRDEKLAVGELAAWTQVASIVLASDAAIMLY
ncbi:MAG: PSD1 and planctomycete cytochrome C domain-containing protein [Planctomycetaceae bacterium]